ncbi:MAG: hypothetical protein H6982_14950 [Chromatiales bacterium]|nr:hypothetical protein [Chromatiales bacterium]
MSILSCRAVGNLLRSFTIGVASVAASLLPPPVVADDPGLTGPYAVTTVEYDTGSNAILPALEGYPGPVELQGMVAHPANLAAGPFPVVLLLHGRHTTCYEPALVPGPGESSTIAGAVFEWPCTAGRLPIPSHRGYDYLAQHLASHGFFVISVSANGINARDIQHPSLGMTTRGLLALEHLAMWLQYATVGGEPYGSRYRGRLDFSRVGLVGHSIGGDGVAVLELLNQLLGEPFGIRAAFMLAPTDNLRLDLSKLDLAVVLPYCDGGLPTLPGIRYFDDPVHVAEGARRSHYQLTMRGANHDAFNSYWSVTAPVPGGYDDWDLAVLYGAVGPDDSACGTTVAGNERLLPADQRAAVVPLATAFLARHLGVDIGSSDAELAEILTGDVPPPSGLGAVVRGAYRAADGTPGVRVVDEFDQPSSLALNALGGLSFGIGLTRHTLCGGPAPQPVDCLHDPSAVIDPHMVGTTERAWGPPGLPRLALGWASADAGYVTLIPEQHGDVREAAVLQFRIALDPTDPANPPGVDRDFLVGLVDDDGHWATARVADWSRALDYPAGSAGPLNPKPLLQGVRIPLTAFDGVDLQEVRAIVLALGALPGQAQGAVFLSEIRFSD